MQLKVPTNTIANVPWHCWGCFCMHCSGGSAPFA